jgi:hypothetical protein
MDYVKKPECSARKIRDERPSRPETTQPPGQHGFFLRRSPVQKHRVLHIRTDWLNIIFCRSLNKE